MARTGSLLTALALAPALHAQLLDGVIAPDFTATDLNGGEHHLYALLDSGYSVVLDFSSAWCIPCWNYHSGGNLETLYTTYGPGTAANKVRVFMIESEPTNTTAQLHGPTLITGDNATTTQGDWVTGTSYPIVDGSFIPHTYEIASVPTLYVVCPDHRLTRVGQETVSQLWTRVQGCPLPQTGTNAALVALNNDRLVCDALAADVSLQNMGTNTITALDIAMRENGNALHTLHWTGELATYGLEHVVFPSMALADPEGVTFEIVQPDVYAADNVLDPGLVHAEPALPEVTFRLSLDRYCSETRWKLFNMAGGVVHAGGPYDCNPDAGWGPDAEQTFLYDWTLTPDCYRLEIYDSYGDGMAASQANPAFLDGSWALYNVGGDTLFSGAGNFGALASGGIHVQLPEGVNATSIDPRPLIAPDPAAGEATVSFQHGGGPVIIELCDAQGRCVRRLAEELPAGPQRQRLDLAGLATGVYSVIIRSAHQRASST
ncbi:MAG TPA: hypothetical protein VHL57_00420, partial [Flavobacteriales bacterium]|nr:hypothetical protein [Flavobacteriales bacterium]